MDTPAGGSRGGGAGVVEDRLGLGAVVGLGMGMRCVLTIATFLWRLMNVCLGARTTGLDRGTVFRFVFAPGPSLMTLFPRRQAPPTAIQMDEMRLRREGRGLEIPELTRLRSDTSSEHGSRGSQEEVVHFPNLSPAAQRAAERVELWS